MVKQLARVLLDIGRSSIPLFENKSFKPPFSREDWCLLVTLGENVLVLPHVRVLPQRHKT